MIARTFLAAAAAACIPAAAPASPTHAIPLSGYLTAQCTEEFFTGTTGVTLLALKLGSFEQPDLLLNEATLGGPALGGASVEGSGYFVPANWREPVMPGDAAVVLVLFEGHAFVDSADFLASGGDLGGTALQAVGARGGPSPVVLATPHGYVLEFAPLVERPPLAATAWCSPGGVAETPGRLFAGYNVYRLDAEAWPDPTLRDFLLHGFVEHVDLAGLDFTVPDGPDGLADRAPSDAAWLRNPDGRADSGDEVIVFRDLAFTPAGAPRDAAPDPARHYWYRVQPVLRGSLAYFDGGLFSNDGARAILIDIDGDGTRESADVMGDGRPEFIDPSARGLGLAHAGEILSSPLPGLGEPAPPRPDADGDGLPDDWEVDHSLDPVASNAARDTDGDGLTDAVEHAVGSHPALADSDGGGEEDGREARYGRSLLNTSDDLLVPAGRPLGDVAPAGGNGRIDVADVVRALRAAVGLQTVGPLELLLADVAPAAPPEGPGSSARPRLRRIGDGRIDIMDVVLQLRLAAGLVEVVE